jgi:hypothetical protein
MQRGFAASLVKPRPYLPVLRDPRGDHGWIRDLPGDERAGRRRGGRGLDHVQKLLAARQLVARTWAAAKREGKNEITEREVAVLLADFATVWSELFTAEQGRIVQLLVERVNVREDALEVRIRAEGLASLVGELRQGQRKAA